MSSFLDRLKKKELVPSTPEDAKQEKIAVQNKAPEETGTPPEQLKVDIFQTPNAIIIYAQIAGASIQEYGVHIEGDGDIVTIKGERTRPDAKHFENGVSEQLESVLAECSWGKFYRQIILPAEVDPAKTEAMTKEGVLMLHLPLKRASNHGIRIAVKEL
jgi:HSP20 family molecular chaperone IbpA